MKFNTPDIRNSYQQRDFTSPTIQAILLAIVLVIFVWFMVRPKLSSYIEVRSNQKVTEEKLKKTKADEADLNQLVSKLHDSKDEVSLIDEALPLSGRVSKANVLIENLVQSSGMTLAQLSSDDSVKLISAGDKDELANPYSADRTLHVIRMTASVTGTMEQYKNLLELIETSSRVLDIESMDVVGGDQQIKFRIIVKAYAYDKSAAEGVTNAK